MIHGYLFVHFKEKKTPDGEQVYFGLSKDGFRWRPLNYGQPVLWSFLGEKGVRDMTIIKARDGKYRIFATDLSLAYSMPHKYGHDWGRIVREGSDCLMCWQSGDLVHWEKQEELRFPGASFGCLWAPDILFDPEDETYLLHWSSTVKGREEEGHAIWCSKTGDFRQWSEPEVLYAAPGVSIIDSALYREESRYYLFVKDNGKAGGVTLLVSDAASGPFTAHPGFAFEPRQADPRHYEAPTAFRLNDGRVCLMVDYFGVPGKGQGYVPYLASSLKEGRFSLAKEAFSFPYGFKHGTVLALGEEEYERLDTLGEFPELGG